MTVDELDKAHDITLPRVWFITGTSTGLGRALTELVLDKGEIVVATARTTAVLAGLTDKHPGSRLLVLPLDVTHPQQIVDAFARAKRAFGRIDVVVNNAGYGHLGEVESISNDMARDIMEVNFWGAVTVSREAMAAFRTNPPGTDNRLNQMSSSSYLGLVGMHGAGFYCASKFALEGFTEALSMELDPDWKIKITIIEPGFIHTEAISKGEANSSTPRPAYTKESLPTNIMRTQRISSLMTMKEPKRSVKLFYDVSMMENPPLRLMVGRDAIEAVSKKITDLAADIAQYESWSEGLEETSSDLNSEHRSL